MVFTSSQGERDGAVPKCVGTPTVNLWGMAVIFYISKKNNLKISFLKNLDKDIFSY